MARTEKNDYSQLTGSDNAFIDSLYDTFKENPDDVDASWQQFFKGFEYKLDAGGEGAVDISHLRKEFNVFRLIQSFRARGHFLSDTNPIKPRKDRGARISLKDYDLEDSDNDTLFFVGEFAGFTGGATLRQIEEKMRRIYCYKIGIEYMHSNNTDIRRWVRTKFEKEAETIDLPVEQKKRILKKLNEGQAFENFLQTKFIGQKRFSLEGGESTIPALDALINKGADLGVEEFVIGMAHRGRLNVLVNTIGKSYEFVFKEFAGGDDQEKAGGGDVKYHQGYTSVQETANGKEVFLKIMHNPSHLECVAPVALGYSRAQADIRYNKDQSKVCPIMIHGDAAVAGQGIVYETLQMAELEAYQCGGAIHFVINNQIGFTTDWELARSSHYCTSIARILDAPVLHVNGDDPECVVYAMEFAMAFRQEFKTDIFIDMVCYRKHGHNEGDEPKYTQPHLYGLISKQKSPRELYMDFLVSRGSINKELATQMQKEFKDLLSERFNDLKDNKMMEKKKGPHTEWLDFRVSKPGDFKKSPETGVKRKTLDCVVNKLTTPPEGFNVLKKARKILADRKKAYDDDKLDWALGELLAYGSLLLEGNNVRFSGQDVVRGTFSHRHAKIFDEQTNGSYCGLSNLSDKQGMFGIYNSHLSEYAVLGFEYGYSLATPHGLNIWEAQFGDFANTAQVIVDQFISSCESKWERMSDLVMLLPHGMEGQGPEHSNAHPERYLSLCADDNMVIVNCTSPAQIFHALRRQQAWEFRKPLIVFTPKSLLRDPRCTSTRAEFENGNFIELLDDETVKKADAKKIKKILFCTGKVFFDLMAKKEEDKRSDVAIVRLEQIYPFPIDQFADVLKKYPNAKGTWVQEECANMGYWEHLLARRFDTFKNFDFVARPLSSSPATGHPKAHIRQLNDILTAAFK